MTFKNPLIIFCLTCLILISCKEEKKTEQNSDTLQMKEVMAIHDEVMPKMSNLGKLVEELKMKEDSTEIGMKYTATRKDLQTAYKSMMDWMQGFGDKFDSDEVMNGKALSEEKQKWLDEEERKIKALREEIEMSIEKAETLLKE